ncbi:MAG: hypothetical protein ACHQYQ_11560 [Bacteriovoracales bacterium]
MKFILSLFLIISTNVFADIAGDKLPKIPEGCFSDKPYCHSSTYDRSRDSEGEREVTFHVNFFARLNVDEFGTIDDLQKRFTDFPAWKRYIQKSKNVRMKYSKKLPDTFSPSGELMMHHVCDYEMRRPFGWEHIVEKSDYFKLPTAEGALLSFKFVLDKTFPETEGIEEKIGVIHVAWDGENNAYNVFLELEVIPETKILPQVGAEVTERGLVDIFLGMFDLL